MRWKLVRIHPQCDSCTLSDDFEGPTDGSNVFPNGDVGATRSVKLRVRPFLGEHIVEWFFRLVANYCQVF